MACNRGRRGTSARQPAGIALPTDPCQLLALARQQMFLLSSGQAVVAIETPELGRVEFSAGKTADLQRMIDGLAAECAAATGTVSTRGRRRPISVEAWP